MDSLIRRVKTGDEAQLAYIHTESWKAGFKDILSEEQLKESADIARATMMYKHLLDNNFGNGYILEVDGKPHCLAWWGKARDTDMPECAELICIHSLPANWRCGYGTKMMNAVLKDMQQAGYQKVMLWVFVENERARKFYEANGFTTRGKVKPSYDTQEICYEKSL